MNHGRDVRIIARVRLDSTYIISVHIRYRLLIVRMVSFSPFLRSSSNLSEPYPPSPLLRGLVSQSVMHELLSRLSAGTVRCQTCRCFETTPGNLVLRSLRNHVTPGYVNIFAKTCDTKAFIPRFPDGLSTIADIGTRYN